MNTILNVLSVIGILFCVVYVAAEAFAAIYIYRNRHTIIPRLFAVLRTGLGVADVNMRLANHDATAKERFDRLERKINFIGKHTQFEREELRRRGILAPAPTRPVAGLVTDISQGRRN